MPNCVAQEIRWLLADESDRRPSAARRLAKARLAASLAEGLDRARIADLRAGLRDGTRAAFLDARLSVADRQIVVTALSHDPAERAEISSAATLLDCIGTDLAPLPPGLLAKAAAAFAAANSTARHGVAVGGRRTWRRQASLIVGVSLAAFIPVMMVVCGLLSPGGNGTLAPLAEPISSDQPTGQPATKPSEQADAGRAVDHVIVLAPDTNEGTKRISARGESGAASCDDDREVARRGHGPCEISKATHGATWDRPQAPPADNYPAKPRFDGPSLRTASSRRPHAFRLRTAVDHLSVVPKGLFEIAGRAVLLFGQLGKDLVDPQCAVLHHQTDGPRSRAALSSISRRNSGRSFPRWCTTHVPITRVHGRDAFNRPSDLVYRTARLVSTEGRPTSPVMR